MCYIILASRVCAQAFGTSDDIPVSDLSRGDREPLRIQRNELSIMAHSEKRQAGGQTNLRLFVRVNGVSMKKKSKNKGYNFSTMRCPYCGAPVKFVSADGIYKENKNQTMLYVCSNYPKCDAYVRAHPGTNIPVGTMANQKLRVLRETAHTYFDRLHTSGIMTKEEAYYWLANLIQAPLSQAHIGYLGEYYCKRVMEESMNLLNSPRFNKKKRKNLI